jgi:hypothetical protein
MSADDPDTFAFQEQPISQLLVKVASRCNIDCSYCYWFRDAAVYDKPKLMSADVHGDFHSEFIVGIAPVATGERNRLPGCPGDSRPDEVTVADDAVRGIEGPVPESTLASRKAPCEAHFYSPNKSGPGVPCELLAVYPPTLLASAYAAPIYD